MEHPGEMGQDGMVLNCVSMGNAFAPNSPRESVLHLPQPCSAFGAGGTRVTSTQEVPPMQ